MTAQPGIFALGTAAQCYLEFDGGPGVATTDLVAAFASVDEPGASIGGANLVVGFRPESWRAVAPDATPEGAAGFAAPVVGPDGFTMPATQHDAWLWVSGASQDIVFDVALALVDELSGVATVATEVTGWPYQRIRDLTGFIDGTENPPLADAPRAVLVRDGAARDASVVLVQQWQHHISEWMGLTEGEQQNVIGRTKRDSVELDGDAQLEDSHVARTVVEREGVELRILRRNTPYGGVTQHGTMFVGFCNDQSVLELMLERMAGAGDGVRDALTRFADPLTGAYYVVPSLDALGRFRGGRATAV
jgi:putative iron-dependent peroxidase